MSRLYEVFREDLWQLAFCNPFLITPERHPAYFIILLHHFWESLLLFQPLMQKIVIDLVSDITPFVSNSTDDSLFL